MRLNLHDREGRLLEPLRYSSGKTQVDLIEEILEAFRENDVVFLKGVVGSGKSIVGLRTILEFGRGVVSVPTKVLSDQYARSYEHNMYFTNSDGEKAKIGILKGRGNFTCPYRDCPSSFTGLPCTRRVDYDSGEKRLDALQECPHWGFIFQSGWARDVEGFGVNPVPYRGIGGGWIWCMKGGCPYWGQFQSYLSSDALVMNSAKWAAEVAIGRLPEVPITVVDEADHWLDQLAVRVSVTEERIKRLTRKIKPDEQESLRELWDGALSGEDPFELGRRLVKLLEDLDETSGNLYWKLRAVLEHEDWAEYEVKKNRVMYYLPDPKPILQRVLDRVGGKWLLMSATVQSIDVLRGVFGIDPFFVEGEAKYPGTLVHRRLGPEPVVNNKRWKNDEFRKRYSKLRSRALKEARRPTFVPVHAYRYVPPRVAKEVRESGDDCLWEGDVMYSTKMDRGIDLEEIESVVMLKFPYPDQRDPLLRGMKRRLGAGVFNRYYFDLSRRDFIQQIGRAMRSDEDVVEFWSPDARCHHMLRSLWKGKISE